MINAEHFALLGLYGQANGATGVASARIFWVGPSAMSGRDNPGSSRMNTATVKVGPIRNGSKASVIRGLYFRMRKKKYYTNFITFREEQGENV